MTDGPEVERVARLMHEAYMRFYKTDLPTQERWGFSEPLPWDEKQETHKDAYRAVARAVLADLCPAPLVVSEEPRGV